MDYPIMFNLLFGLKLLTERHDLSHSVCHVQCVNIYVLTPLVSPIDYH